jgi:hypothetical protein
MENKKESPKKIYLEYLKFKNSLEISQLTEDYRYYSFGCILLYVFNFNLYLK